RPLLPRIGREDSSITCFAPATRIPKNGTMYARTLSELAWQRVGRNGRTLARYLISNFTTRAFDSAVTALRPPNQCDSQRLPLQLKPSSRLRFGDLAFAFGVKRVVNDEFALENFVIAQAELAEAPGNPA